MEPWVIGTADEARAWLRETQFLSGPYGFDLETVGINPKTQPAAGDHGRIVCFTVARPLGIEPNGNLKVDGTFFWGNPDVVEVMGPWWSTAPVVGHNLYGFDAHLCRRAGYPLNRIVMDTLRAHRLINTDPDARHGLKALMELWLGIAPVGKIDSLFSRRKCLEEVPGSEIKSTWRKVADEPRVPTITGGAHSRVGDLEELIPLDRIAAEFPHLLPSLIEYALLDAVATLRLWWAFSQRMESTAWVQDFDV